MTKFYKIIPLAAVLVLGVLLGACGDDAPKVPKKAERTVLVYAVASNNLNTFLRDDKNEMIDAAPYVAGLGKDVRVLVYEVASASADQCTLAELKRNEEGQWVFHELKTYDRDTYSTDPSRMSEVFSDVAEISPSDTYGLVFWSHGTGWIPDFADHEVDSPVASPARVIQKSFGYDKYNGKVDYCDIDELAEAIPSGMFDYIWFDCCYMMCIETAYQLRDKCDYVCGYPTEDWDTGMNYDSTLPLLARKNPDLSRAAKSFFDYYEVKGIAATVTVAATDGLEELADVSRRIYAEGSAPSYAGLQNYSRLGYGLYDFGQYTRLYLSDAENAEGLMAEFDAALGKVVKYAACTSIGFDRKPLDPDIYSGFSCHYPGLKTNGNQEKFYYSLDWPGAVYK